MYFSAYPRILKQISKLIIRIIKINIHWPEFPTSTKLRAIYIYIYIYIERERERESM